MEIHGKQKKFYFDFPKGRRKKRETDISCAIRETNEELEGLGQKILPSYSNQIQYEHPGFNGVKIRIKLFIIPFQANQWIRIKETFKFQGVQWVDEHVLEENSIENL